MTRGRSPKAFIRVLAVSLLAVSCGGSDRPAGDAADRPAAGSAPAATPAGGAISDSELQGYRLTMDRMQAWHRVQLASANRPDLLLGEDDQESLDNMDARTASRLLARIEDHAEISRIIRQHGMEPRDFVLSTFALAFAVIGDAVSRTGNQSIPDGTNRDNVAFVRQHQAELQRMREEQDAARRAAGHRDDG